MKAQEKLESKIKNNLHICVGLDSDIQKIPPYLKTFEDPILEFNKIIINNTKDSAAAYKINFAFYERNGVEGLKSLERTLELLPDDVLIIGDAKRGDIGNTSKMYAQSIFDHFGFDSITLSPYMGRDSVEPFLEYADKISFILALTSNKSNQDIEKVKLSDGSFLFQHVIKQIDSWNERSNCGAVFGATNIEELKANLELFKDMPILLPGVGAQGGSLEEVVAAFKFVKKDSYLINISRALIYASSNEDFGTVVNKKLDEFNNNVLMIKS